MRVLTWNLFHGRAVPPAGRNLLDEYAAALAGWDWDVALLQEVPPWWGPALGAACEAHPFTALTSRNLGLPVRRWIAERWPDLIKSNGGGANAILVRGTGAGEHRQATLRRWPERRVVHGVRLAGGTWVANLHAQVHTEEGAQTDIYRAAKWAAAWAGRTGPLILGGDLNVTTPIAPGFTDLGWNHVDHVLGRGLVPVGRGRTLPRGPLSDHAPVLVEVAPEGEAQPGGPAALPQSSRS